MCDTNDNYETGYGKPPRKHQFKPGQSGNPKGRPKKSKDPLKRYSEILGEPINVTALGRSEVLSIREANFWKLVEQALKGDFRSQIAVLKIDAQYIAPTEPEFGDNDHEAFINLFRDIASSYEPKESDLEERNGQHE